MGWPRSLCGLRAPAASPRAPRLQAAPWGRPSLPVGVGARCSPLPGSQKLLAPQLGPTGVGAESHGRPGGGFLPPSCVAAEQCPRCAVLGRTVSPGSFSQPLPALVRSGPTNWEHNGWRGPRGGDKGAQGGARPPCWPHAEGCEGCGALAAVLEPPWERAGLPPPGGDGAGRKPPSPEEEGEGLGALSHTWGIAWGGGSPT